jgi:transposase
MLCSNRISPDQEKRREGKELLLSYKGQTGVEGNFRFLKDPLIVNDLFLKKEERIEALGLVLILSLLVYNLIQRSMRKYVEKTGEDLIGFDNKPTKKPTTYMITWAFKNFHIIKYREHRKISSKMNKDQELFLKAMGLSFNIFTEIKQKC